MNAPEAAEWLYEADQAHRRAGTARHSFWFPLVLFGAILLIAFPLYRFPTLHITRVGVATYSPSLGPFRWFAGGFFLESPGLVALYWLMALPAGYLITVLWYRHEALRKGIASPVLPYVLTGLGLLGFLLITPLVRGLQPGDLFIRGYTPILTVSLGLFVLAWDERSRALGHR